jgi:DNA-binding Xre family transcriptional regulator
MVIKVARIAINVADIAIKVARIVIKLAKVVIKVVKMTIKVARTVIKVARIAINVVNLVINTNCVQKTKTNTPTMLHWNIKAILKQRGYKPTPFFLTNIGIPKHTAKALLYKQVQNLSLKNIETLCIFFRCTPNELLAYIPDPNHELQATQPILQLQADEEVNPLGLLKSLSNAEIIEVDQYIKQYIANKEK